MEQLNIGIDIAKKPDFKVGDKVEKVTGDYNFKGTVVATFNKIAGQDRYVVENEDGILHIFGPKNLKVSD